jgi:hypothetical protein
MNKIEKIVYDILKGNPRIKLAVRNIYQTIFDLIPNKKNFSINKILVNEGYFFGFHDITPFSNDDSKILANKLIIPLRMPNIQDSLEIGYFPFKGNMGGFVKLGSSKTWNYHKGCRLQWLDKNHIIFNDLVNNKIGSRIINIKTKEERSISFPIDAVSKCAKYGTSFSYERLEKLMPGYGYDVEDDSFINENVSEKTGLYLIDLNSNKQEQLCSLKLLSELGQLSNESLNSNHYVTHTLFSHDSKFVAFLHRWIKDDVTKRWSRLIVYDIELKEFHISPTDDMVSHYVWNSRNQIIAYCRLGGIDSHVLFEEPTLKVHKRIAYPKINSDGHQSFITDSSFVTDTYPDKYRMANLLKVDIIENKVTHLASLNSFKRFQSKNAYHHWACDFHPRMNNAGNMVCFDSVHYGERALCLMSLK